MQSEENHELLHQFHVKCFICYIQNDDAEASVPIWFNCKK